MHKLNIAQLMITTWEQKQPVVENGGQTFPLRVGDQGSSVSGGDRQDPWESERQRLKRREGSGRGAQSDGAAEAPRSGCAQHPRGPGRTRGLRQEEAHRGDQLQGQAGPGGSQAWQGARSFFVLFLHETGSRGVVSGVKERSPI